MIFHFLKQITNKLVLRVAEFHILAKLLIHNCIRELQGFFHPVNVFSVLSQF